MSILEVMMTLGQIDIIIFHESDTNTSIGFLHDIKSHDTVDTLIHKCKQELQRNKITANSNSYFQFENKTIQELPGYYHRQTPIAAFGIKSTIKQDKKLVFHDPDFQHSFALIFSINA